jgi:hypothetical protein
LTGLFLMKFLLRHSYCRDTELIRSSKVSKNSTASFLSSALISCSIVKGISDCGSGRGSGVDGNISSSHPSSSSSIINISYRFLFSSSAITSAVCV